DAVGQAVKYAPIGGQEGGGTLDVGRTGGPILHLDGGGILDWHSYPQTVIHGYFEGNQSSRIFGKVGGRFDQVEIIRTGIGDPYRDLQFCIRRRFNRIGKRVAATDANDVAGPD